MPLDYGAPACAFIRPAPQRTSEADDTPEIIARISRDYPSIEWATVNSQYDVVPRKLGS
jgi:hypothetical protein